jgi:hypothetical protein
LALGKGRKTQVKTANFYALGGENIPTNAQNEHDGKSKKQNFYRSHFQFVTGIPRLFSDGAIWLQKYEFLLYLKPQT